MDQLSDTLRDLVDSLDLHPRYHLRRTASRRNRLIDILDLHNLHQIPNMAPPTTTTSTPSTSTTSVTSSPIQCSQTYTLTIKFCGNVPDGTADKAKLEAYDVNRWLADTQTRIAAKGITDPRLMIKEAKLAVNPDVGDAARVLNTGRMCVIENFDVFKEKCLRLWRPPEEKDRFLALLQFLSVKRQDTIGSYISDIEKSRQDIITDLTSDSNFKQGTAAEWQASGRTDTLVSLDEILNYVSWGIIYQDSSPTWRKAFRKIKPKFDADYIELLSDIQAEVAKLEKSPQIELSAFTERNDPRQQNRQQNRQQFRQQENTQNRQDRSFGGARPKSNRNFQGSRSQQQGQSQRSWSSQRSDRFQCNACGRLGHVARFCRFTQNNQQLPGGQSGNKQGNRQNTFKGNRNSSTFESTSDASTSNKQDRD